MGLAYEIFYIDKTPRIVRKKAMTGAELKALGEINSQFDLFEEVEGNDDLLIKDNDLVNLENGRHFRSVRSALSTDDRRA